MLHGPKNIYTVYLVRQSLPHPLAVLRFVLQLTQDEFAKKVGFSKSLIRSIENNQRSITVELSEAMFVQFGIVGRQLEAMNGPRGSEFKKWPESAKSGLALEFTATVGSHKRSCGSINEESEYAFVELVQPRLLEMVAAAKRLRRGAALLVSLDGWMKVARAEFGLPESKVKTPPFISRNEWGFGITRTRASMEKEAESIAEDIPIPEHVAEYVRSCTDYPEEVLQLAELTEKPAESPKTSRPRKAKPRSA